MVRWGGDVTSSSGGTDGSKWSVDLSSASGTSLLFSFFAPDCGGTDLGRSRGTGHLALSLFDRVKRRLPRRLCHARTELVPVFSVQRATFLLKCSLFAVWLLFLKNATSGVIPAIMSLTQLWTPSLVVVTNRGCRTKASQCHSLYIWQAE